MTAATDLRGKFAAAGRRLAEHDAAFPPAAGKPTELDRRAALLRSHLEWELVLAGMELGLHLEKHGRSPREATLPIGGDL